MVHAAGLMADRTGEHETLRSYGASKNESVAFGIVSAMCFGDEQGKVPVARNEIESGYVPACDVGWLRACNAPTGRGSKQY